MSTTPENPRRKAPPRARAGRSAAAKAGPTQLPSLDNLTLSRKEGWRAYVEALPRPQPDPLTPRELAALTDRARSAYDRQRRIWHANLPIIKTAQLLELHESLWVLVDSNMQDGDKAKGAVGIEAAAGVGKSIAVQDFAADYHRREIDELGEYTADGNERWPVCRVGMTGNTGMKEFNRAMLRFYNHAGTKRGTTAEFADRALDCVLSCETKLLIVDDLHFLKFRTTRVEISNQFKYISNEFPLTIIFIGIGLRESGLYSDGTYADQVLGQTGRRTTPLTMREFNVDDEPGRHEWRQLLLTLEKRIALACKYRGMLADDLSDYLWERSSGRMGSLMPLIARGCNRAVRSGAEVLNQELLEQVPADEAAAQNRAELRRQIQTGNLITQPKRRRRLP
jgi:hypothetical protein